jgi:hypothetical protein
MTLGLNRPRASKEIARTFAVPYACIPDSHGLHSTTCPFSVLESCIVAGSARGRAAVRSGQRGDEKDICDCMAGFLGAGCSGSLGVPGGGWGCGTQAWSAFPVGWWRSPGGPGTLATEAVLLSAGRQKLHNANQIRTTANRLRQDHEFDTPVVVTPLHLDDFYRALSAPRSRSRARMASQQSCSNAVAPKAERSCYCCTHNAPQRMHA